MNKNSKKKNNKNKIILVFILILLLIIGFVYFYINNSKDEVKIIKTIKNYDYSLNDNETQLYNKTFEKLEKILAENNVDYDEYAKCIAELYVIDFYTLSNKLSKNDIGGTQFIHPDIKDNFIEKARSTFYKYLQVKSNSRNQELPEVSKIQSVSVENESFTYTDKTVDDNAYKVTINWSYQYDYEYEESKEIILVREDKKLYIIQAN